MSLPGLLKNTNRSKQVENHRNRSKQVETQGRQNPHAKLRVEQNAERCTVTELLTPADAAVRLRVKPETIKTWLRQGRIKGLKAGRFWRIPTEEIDNFLKPGIPANEVNLPANEVSHGAIPGRQETLPANEVSDTGQ